MPAETLSVTRAAALRNGAAVVSLPGRGSLCVTGPDAAELLHGLVTNEVKALRPGAGCHAALLTPKGRERPLGPVDPDGAVQRDVVRAIDAARRARALLPADADVADTLGWLLWLDGDEKGARELLDEAIRTGDRADARFHLALVEIEAGRGDAARPLLRRAIEQAPTAPWAARAKELAAR